jgi:hypothetical protein
MFGAHKAASMLSTPLGFASSRRLSTAGPGPTASPRSTEPMQEGAPIVSSLVRLSSADVYLKRGACGATCYCLPRAGAIPDRASLHRELADGLTWGNGERQPTTIANREGQVAAWRPQGGRAGPVLSTQDLVVGPSRTDLGSSDGLGQPSGHRSRGLRSQDRLRSGLFGREEQASARTAAAGHQADTPEAENRDAILIFL